MGIARSTTDVLRSSGHDVVHLLDQGLERLADELIVAKAVNEDRIIVTHDLDFSRIVALSGNDVPSVVTLRLSDMSPANVLSVLRGILEQADSELESGALVSVSDGGFRIRPIPVRGS